MYLHKNQLNASFRIMIGTIALLISISLIATGIEMTLAGKDFFAWSGQLGLGIPMLIGGVGLIFNWFGKDDFLYWPF